MRLHELVAVNPAGIPSDANNQKVYKDLLGSVEALASPLPLCDKSSGEDGNVPEADGSSSVEENAPNACPLAKRPRRSSQLAPTAPRQQSWFDLFCGEQLSSLGGKAQQGQDVAGSVAGSSGLQLDSSGRPVQPVSVHGGGVGASGGERIREGNGEGSGQSANVCDVAGSGEQAGSVNELESVGAERPLPFWIEGCRVRAESQHGSDVRTQFYSRIGVVCPCDEHKGRPPCKKQRNLGLAQCAALGVFEPCAFLGARLVARSRFATKADHQKHIPTAADVEAYLDAKGWPRGHFE